jgi:calcineurin-like phosphoesterase family protein
MNIPTLWFTADLHLGHTNIIRHCGRPFDSVEEMDQVLIQNINDCVKKQDRLYILGDFCGQRRKSAYIQSYLNRIHLHPNQIFLILGNHDDEKHSKRVFPNVYERYTVKHEGEQIVLSHYAMRTWNQSGRGRWHLYGHSHGNLPDYGKSFDVGVDVWDFKPISFEQVKEQMDKREILSEDHH